MPINPCETKFFDWLQANSEENSDPLNIHLIRERAKKLSVFVDNAAEINFGDIKIKSQEGHAIRFRYYHEMEATKPLIIFLPGNGFFYK